MTNPNCPQCHKNDELTQMSGVSIAGHEKYVKFYHLCFRCKIWVDENGCMIQTI